jgi:WD40 repeat protein
MSNGKRFFYLTPFLFSPLFFGDGLKSASAQKDKPPGRFDKSGDPLPPGALARLGSLRFRWFFSGFAVSPDGKRYALGSWDKASIVETSSGKLLFHLEGEGMCRPMVFSPDGKILAITDKKGLKLWDIDKRQIVQNKRGTYNGVFFSPNGKKIALSNEDAIRLWDPSAEKEIWSRKKSKDETSIYPFGFTSDGKTLVVEFFLRKGGRTVRFLDIAAGKEIRPAKTLPIGSDTVNFSPDGKTLVRASWEGLGEVDLEDLKTGETLLRFGGFKPLDRLAFSPNGKLLAWGSSKGIIVLDVARGRELYRIEGLKGKRKNPSFQLFTFLPDNKTIAFTVNYEQVIQFWNIEKKALERQPDAGHRRGILQLAFTADSRKLFSAALNGSVRLWDVASKKELDRMETIFDFNATLTSEGKIGVTDRFEGKPLSVWDFFTKKKLLKLEEVGRYFHHAQRGHFLAVRTFEGIALWDLRAGKKVRRLKTEASPRVFSPDGKYLVATGKMGIDVWEIKTKKQKSSFSLPEKHFDAFSFSADGRFLAAMRRGLNIGKVVLLEFPSLKQRLEWQGRKDSVALSPDGSILAMGSLDGKIMLWDLVKNQKIRECDGHLGSVSSLAFSGDSKYLASGGLDTTILLWDLESLRRQQPKAR